MKIHGPYRKGGFDGRGGPLHPKKIASSLNSRISGYSKKTPQNFPENPFDFSRFHFSIR